MHMSFRDVVLELGNNWRNIILVINQIPPDVAGPILLASLHPQLLGPLQQLLLTAGWRRHLLQ